jgi:hypothetical protein
MLSTEEGSMLKRERCSQILGVLFVSVILITISSATAFAQVVLNQPPDQINAFWSDVDGSESVAENFVVSSTVNVAQIRIWGIYFFTGTPPVTDNFTVIFHFDSSGLPGAAFSTQTNVPVTRQLTGGTFAGYAEYVYTLTLTTPVNLIPGTYWVEIYGNTTGDGDNIYNFGWETGTVDPTHGITGAAQSATVPGTGWSPQVYDFAIEINAQSAAVPTMTEWGMIIFAVLAGLGAVYSIRKQRRAEV